MRVRAHLALMSAVILLPVVILSVVALAILLKAERDSGQRGVRETARSIRLGVDRELALAETALKTLATSRRLTDGDFEAFAQQARAARTSESSWIILFDESARQVVNTRFPEGRGRMRANPEQVTKVLASNRTAVSTLYRGVLSGAMIVTIDVPVVLNGQRFVLTQAFQPEHFNAAFADAAIPEGGLVGIFDSEGATIASSRRAVEFVGKPGAALLVEAIRRAPQGELRHVTRDGIEVYDFFVRSQRSDWTVVVGVPVAGLEGAARRAVSVAGVGIFATLAAAVLFALLASRRLTGAIASTAASATALGRGRAPEFQATDIREIDQLQATLAEAGALLAREREAREAAEAERSRLLESEQAARQSAEAQNRSKDEFLAMLGHELRNPLSAISGAVGVLHTGTASPDSERYARDVVERQSAHLGRIVDDLLDVSRVMTGKVRLDLQRADLAEALSRCVGTLGAAGKTSRHEVDIRSVPAWIDADVTRLDQVISNLLVNAVKYSPEGGRVECEVRIDDGEAVLSIRDNGVGIPAPLLPRVFDIFVQGTASLDRAQGGLGLGLALVQRLVAMHGGTATATSEGEGRGSEFTLRFPRVPAPAPQAPPAAVAPGAQGTRVLLVDDHEDARGMTRMLLEILGHSVIEAGDGPEGIALAQAEALDAAVVDIGLPGIDGYEVARRLRADPRTARLPLVALTGYGQDEDRRRALEAGFDEHLVKPVEPQALLAAIAAAIGKRRTT